MEPSTWVFEDGNNVLLGNTRLSFFLRFQSSSFCSQGFEATSLMEISAPTWLSEQGMEDPSFVYHYNQMNPLDYSIVDLNFQTPNPVGHSTNDQSFDSQSMQNLCYASFEAYQTSNERTRKQAITNGWASCTTSGQISSKPSPSFSSQIFSLENLSSPPAASQNYYPIDTTIRPKNEVGCCEHLNYTSHIPSQVYDQDGPRNNGHGTKNVDAITRSPLQAQDHAIAERKRREKLNKQFIALSAVVPNLKKMDKVSVLGDTIKYLKYLQERVKTLEEQAAMKIMESVVLVKKRRFYAHHDESSSSDKNSDGCCEQLLPEIEARVSGKDIVLRIHCEKRRGGLMKVLSEIETLHLNVISSSALPFGNSTINVTVVAERDVKSSMTVKDIVRNLRQALL